MIIHNQPTSLTLGQRVTTENSIPTTSRKARGRRRGNISGAAITSYIGVFLLVVTLVLVGYQPPVRQAALASSNAESSAAGNVAAAPASTSGVTVDQLTATNLASSLAETTDMPISNDIANLSQSLTVESQLSQTDTNVISKPQIVQLTASSRTPTKYTTVAGDTAQSIAQKNGISPTTVKWVNNLTSDAIEAGKTLTILPMDGILYTVKSGDTVDSIVSKYGANKAQVVTLNDLDLSGDPAAGTQLIIPGGQLPTNEQPGYVAPVTRTTAVMNGISYNSYGGGSASSYSGGVSAGNRYSYGQCTWYAYERRMQLGLPVGGMWGNAYSWAYSAQAAGFIVDGNPTAGSVMQNSGGYGHVAVVESVNPGVSITISEMNAYRFGGGWNRVGRGEISWSEAVSGYYKYIH